MEYIDRKIKIDNPEECRAVQEKLFSLGYTWNGKKDIKYLDAKSLYTWDGGTLAYSNSDWTFKNNEKKELSIYELLDILNYEIY